MKHMDMTKGSVTYLFILFALPLMLGDLFQQLYIAIDSAIVGQFVGSTALAAVGSTTFLIRMVIGLFVGISAGASVIIAQSVGAKDFGRLGQVIHTMAGLTLVGGTFLIVIAIALTDQLLYLVSTPEEVFREASIYLKIYFAGLLFELIYNVGSGILRSFGDSKRPFCYLVVSSVSNIILDYLLIAVLGMGVAGAAIATVLSQGIAAIMVVHAMLHTTEAYKIVISRIRIDKQLVPEILRMGLPAGLQSMIVALSNVIVQANINEMGTAVVAGFGVFNKVDGVIMLPVSALALSAMTFTGQNYGAGKKKRIVKGIQVMLILQLASWFLGFVICLVGGEQILSLFSKDAEIIHYGLMTMWYDLPCYWAMAIGYAMTCVIRGMGHSRAASIIFVANMCFVRQVWILFANHIELGLEGILLSYPISWLFTVAGTLLYALYLKHIGEFEDEERNKKERILCIQQGD